MGFSTIGFSIKNKIITCVNYNLKVMEVQYIDAFHMHPSTFWDTIPCIRYIILHYNLTEGLCYDLADNLASTGIQGFAG